MTSAVAPGALPWTLCNVEEGPGSAKRQEFLRRLAGRKVVFLGECLLRWGSKRSAACYCHCVGVGALSWAASCRMYPLSCETIGCARSDSRQIRSYTLCFLSDSSSIPVASHWVAEDGHTRVEWRAYIDVYLPGTSPARC